MVNIVKNRECVLTFSVTSDKELGQLNGIIYFNGDAKVIDDLKDGATLVLSAEETASMDEGEFGCELNVTNIDNSYFQKIMVSTKVLPEGSNVDGKNVVYLILRVIKNTPMCKDIDTFPKKVKANNKIYQIDLLDDKDGIDMSINRSVR